MTDESKIEYIPIDLGLGPLEPPGRLRLSYKSDWGGWSNQREDWDWIVDELTAEFGLGPDFTDLVRIEFTGSIIFQVLDESWASMSSASSRWTGDLTTFAREVIGNEYALLHEAFFDLNRGAKHYQFVTSDACLDVLSASPPRCSLYTSTD